MNVQTFWNEIGVQKDFEDPLYLEKLEPFIHPHSEIVEYGCGYGRLLNLLDQRGYKNLKGYDFAPNMIARGKEAFPELSLEYIEESGKMPLEDKSVDAVILSTILCCIVDKEEQSSVIGEVQRVLKPGGVLYLSDFLITDHERYPDKYMEGYHAFHEWGIYTTSEGIIVRHHSTQWIMCLLEEFDIQWFEQFDFKTMNDNYVRTFHCLCSTLQK